MQKVLLIINRVPYDGSDVVWNALRLAQTLVGKGARVQIFLKNDAVDLARESCMPPFGYDQDLKAMFKALIGLGVPVGVCATCMARCGVHKNEPYYEGATTASMDTLAQWVLEADKVLTY